MSYNTPHHHAYAAHPLANQVGPFPAAHSRHGGAMPPGYEADQGEYGLESWFNFRNSGYLKGFVVGAGLALVLTNPTVQKALVSGAVRVWSAVQGGVEEVKEQIQDIKAEMSQKE